MVITNNTKIVTVGEKLIKEMGEKENIRQIKKKNLLSILVYNQSSHTTCGKRSMFMANTY